MFDPWHSAALEDEWTVRTVTRFVSRTLVTPRIASMSIVRLTCDNTVLLVTIGDLLC